jgi:hypothetical protein
MKKHLPIAVLLACAVVFACGIYYLFQLRFATGDVYPAYSSLRADPLGTMALYESLGKIPGLSVRRDFSASDELPPEPQTAYLHLAGESEEWRSTTQELSRNIEDFVNRGGRLVITFFPQTEPEDYWGEEDKDTNSTASKTIKGGKMTPPEKKDKDSSDEEESLVSLERNWGFGTGFIKLEPDGDSYAPVTVVNCSALPLPQTLDWHSGVVFTNVAKTWNIIYTRDVNPVVIERQFGKGSVVIATDSYFVSDEAMLKDRHADLIAWLVGPEKNVVFDEAHLGIVETSGVAILIRKYRLHGLVFGLILLAGLFVWKNSLSLVPPSAGETGDNFVAGKDSAAGFVNLLRRCIAPRDVLGACFSEWKKSVAPAGRMPSSRLRQAEEIFLAENLPSSNPLETYKKISETIGTRNEKL